MKKLSLKFYLLLSIMLCFLASFSLLFISSPLKAMAGDFSMMPNSSFTMYSSNKQSNMITINSKGTKELFARNNLDGTINVDTTKTYYTMYLTSATSIPKIWQEVRTFNNNKNLEIEVRGENTLATEKGHPRLESIVQLSNELLKAGENNFLSLELSATMQGNGRAIKTFVGFQVGDKANNKFELENINLEGAESSTTGEISKGTDYFTRVLIENPKKQFIKTVFSAERDGSWKTGQQVSMIVKNPVIVVNSLDATMPTIANFTFKENVFDETTNSYVLSDVDTNNQKWSDKKIVTFTACDNESGVGKILLNGVEQTPKTTTDDHKTKTYEIEISKNGNYTLVAEDNVGNRNIIWDNLNITNIDSQGYENAENQINVTIAENTKFTTKEFVIPFTFKKDQIQGHSEDIINYSVTNGSEIIVEKTNFDINNSTSENFNLSLNFANKTFKTGTFTLNLIVSDSAGHSQTKTFNFAYDVRINLTLTPLTTKYTYNPQGMNLQYNFSENVESVPNVTFEYFKKNENGTFETLSITDLIDGGVGIYKVVYTIGGAQDDAYTGYGEFEIEVFQRKVLIKVKEAFLSKFYGQDDPIFNQSSLTILDKALQDQIFTGSFTRRAGENKGKYNFNIDTLGSNNPNYQFVFIDKSFTIKATPLTIKVNGGKALNLVYGTPFPESVDWTFETNIEGVNLINAKNNITGDIIKVEETNVGTYPLIGDFLSLNYDLTIINSTCEISKKPIKIVAKPVVFTYGDEVPQLDFDITGLVYGDTKESIRGKLSWSDNASLNANELNESYTITLGDLVERNPNYDFTDFTTANLKIEKALVYITINNVEQDYGEEVDKELTYKVEGLKFNDKIELKLYRLNAGVREAGTYDIVYKLSMLKNYHIANFNDNGTYTINPIQLVPKVYDQQVIYNGNFQEFTNTDFPFELEYTYKYTFDGSIVDCPVDAGKYIVNATFKGNNNYLPSATVEEAIYTIEPQTICFNLGTNKFIYDGDKKYPTYDFYDKSKTLSKTDDLEYIFENDIEPIEVGIYNFTIRVRESKRNFKGQISGKLEIEEVFKVVGNESIIQSNEASFDKSAQSLRLVMNESSGNFNNQSILQSCSFENFTKDNAYVYTVRVKAKTDDSNVYVYKVDANNNYTEMVVSVEDGYYVFKVDGLDCKYIITKDIEPMSLITLATIIGVSLLVIVALIVALKIRRVHRRKLAKAVANKQNKIIADKNAKLKVELENSNSAKQQTYNAKQEISNNAKDEIAKSVACESSLKEIVSNDSVLKDIVKDDALKSAMKKEDKILKEIAKEQNEILEAIKDACSTNLNTKKRKK